MNSKITRCNAWSQKDLMKLLKSLEKEKKPLKANAQK